MDMLRRLFGADEPRSRSGRSLPRSGELSPDERAVERYRYLLRTAPPETIEDAHAEAFARLTPEQRRIVLQELNSTLTAAERAAGTTYDEDPRSLARLATRAEVRQPGTLERTWSGMPAGIGMGSLMMGNFMSTIAGVMVGSMITDAFVGNAGSDTGSGTNIVKVVAASMIADAFLGHAGYDAGFAEAADASPDTFDAQGGDVGGGDSGFGDGGAFGDIGGFGDFGGGDF